MTKKITPSNPDAKSEDDDAKAAADAKVTTTRIGQRKTSKVHNH